MHYYYYSVLIILVIFLIRLRTVECRTNGFKIVLDFKWKYECWFYGWTKNQQIVCASSVFFIHTKHKLSFLVLRN